jgi:hypothetical protein
VHEVNRHLGIEATLATALSQRQIRGVAELPRTAELNRHLASMSLFAIGSASAAIANRKNLRLEADRAPHFGLLEALLRFALLAGLPALGSLAQEVIR